MWQVFILGIPMYPEASKGLQEEALGFPKVLWDQRASPVPYNGVQEDAHNSLLQLLSSYYDKSN